jgi:hypothetical protein
VLFRSIAPYAVGIGGLTALAEIVRQTLYED